MMCVCSEGVALFHIILIFRIQVRNPILECNFDHGEVRTRQSPLKSMYSKRFQYLHDKTMYIRGLLRCGWRLDCYRGMEGSLEGLNLQNVCNCGRYNVVCSIPVLSKGKNDILYTVHNVGVWDEKPLCLCCRLTGRWILTPGSQPSCA